jgi:hypothetical protein
MYHMRTRETKSAVTKGKKNEGRHDLPPSVNQINSTDSPHPVLVRESGESGINICSELPREEGITDQDKDPKEHDTENQAPGDQLLFHGKQRLVLLLLPLLCFCHLKSPPSEVKNPRAPARGLF